jgi:hypothetical protein
MIPGLLAALPSGVTLAKYGAAVAAGAGLLLLAYCQGREHEAAKCQEAELKRQLVEQREQTRIAEEALQVERGSRLAAERLRREAEAASERARAAGAEANWQCGTEAVPEGVWHEVR